ncbi:MAG: hypothetical protein J0M26_20545 [Planctomycetes bacterium]|nr:hypothetical protein [Planctomycetota bacterium]
MKDVDDTQEHWMVDDHSDSDQELLTAFLDGELTAEENAQLQQRLASDPKLKNQLESMRSTWNMLDELPQTPADIKLTQTTMELVALDIKTQQKKRRTSWWLFSLATVVIGVLGGLLLANFQVRRERTNLLRDLPVLANFQVFRELDSVDILPELAKLKHLEIFLKESDVNRVRVPMDADAREAWLAQSTPERLQELADVKSHFDRLPENEQEKLRTVHQKIAASEDPVQTTDLVRAYINLLRSLTTNERAKLLDKPMDQRIEGLQGVVQRKRVANLAQNMTDQDKEAFRQWARDLLWERPDWLMVRGPNEGLRPGDELRIVVQGLFRRRMETGGSPLDTSEINKLRNYLSDQANEILDDANESEIDFTLTQWIFAAMARGRLKDPDFKELADMYDTFSDTEREIYDWMTPGEAKTALTRKYRSRIVEDGMRDGGRRSPEQ